MATPVFFRKASVYVEWAFSRDGRSSARRGPRRPPGSAVSPASSKRPPRWSGSPGEHAEGIRAVVVDVSTSPRHNVFNVNLQDKLLFARGYPARQFFCDAGYIFEA